ncbi:MAG: hypothetical protein ACYC91_17850 [Solirubrobacteraceae bacterium]
MRPRHLLILVLLAGIPVALGVLLIGSGGERKPARGQPVVQVSLRMVGGERGPALLACGVTHHYTIYRAGTTLRFHGTISYSGRWTLKLKLKACTAGAFRSAGDATAKVHADASYKGSLPAPIAGQYFARAELRLSGALIARSDKHYFEVR